jgi:small subunit ribosomal protein S9
MAKGKTYKTQTVGRRKSSVARVYLADGSGKITVNKREQLQDTLLSNH